MMTDQQRRDYLRWLKDECGYKHIRLMPDGRWAAVYPLLFTAAVIVGRVGDKVGFDDRWCYHDAAAACLALAAWDGCGEPQGWHRHPATGRRVGADGTEEVYA